MGALFRLACLAVLVTVAGQRRPAVASTSATPPLRSGDVVLQASSSGRSTLIRRATHSLYSHVGLVEVADDGVWVLEAVEPVSRTPFATFARRSGGQVTVLRAKGLDEKAARAVVAEAKRFLGRPYDARYQWDDERVYCSELVAKAFARGAHRPAGRFERLQDLDVGVEGRALMGQLGVDPAQEVLTPESLAADEGFTRVWTNVPGQR